MTHAINGGLSSSFLMAVTITVITHWNEIKKLVQESDVLVHSAGIVDTLTVPVVKTIEEKLGQPLLTKIAEASGGRNCCCQ